MEKVRNYLVSLKERIDIIERRLKEHEDVDTAAVGLIWETIRQIAIDAINMLDWDGRS